MRSAFRIKFGKTKIYLNFTYPFLYIPLVTSWESYQIPLKTIQKYCKMYTISMINTQAHYLCQCISLWDFLKIIILCNLTD
jgi:hypothetical protein